MVNQHLLTIQHLVSICKCRYVNILLIVSFIFLPGEFQSVVSEQPPSLTESMQMMDDVLSDKLMDRLEKIERLESLLTMAMDAEPDQTDGLNTSPLCCKCTCHLFSTDTVDMSTQTEPL